MSEQTCQSCEHWHKRPADPMHLGAPPAGECRASPLFAPFANQNGAGAIFLGYPTVPANLPVCSHFQERADVKRLLEELDSGHKVTLHALANTAEEDGEQELAEGYRWLARHDKWPARGVDALWRWSCESWPESDNGNRHVLPDDVCRLLPGWLAGSDNQPAWKQKASLALSEAAAAAGKYLAQKTKR